jgi:two-component system, NtrC family, sensor kinase
LKFFFLILFIYLLPHFATAQQNPYWQEPSRVQADSLRAVFNHTGNDSIRMYVCRELGLYYQEINRDSSLYFYQKQLLLAQKLNFKIWEGESLNRIGYITILLGNFSGALKSLLQAKDIAADKNTGDNIWGISLFSRDKNPDKARLTLSASVEAHRGILYFFAGDLERSLAHYFESRNIAARLHDKALFSIVDMNIGEIYLHQFKLDSALMSERMALQYSEESGYIKYRGFILYLTGRIYEKQNNIAQAKKYYHESIESSLSQQSFDFLGMSYISLSGLLKKEGSIDSSLWMGQQGLKTYQGLKDQYGLSEVYKLLAAIYKSRHKTDSAFYFQELASVAKDSLNEEEKVRSFQTAGFKEEMKLQELEKEQIRIQNKVRTYAMLTGLGVFMLIAFLLYRNNRYRKRANELLLQQKDEIELQKRNVEATLTDLKSTQSQLIQSEKMASLGQLTAGIAHEIQNPLNFVNNFSDVNAELLLEMKNEIDKGNLEEAKVIANDIIENEAKINHHGKRADIIVKGMLQHSRSTSGTRELTDLNALAGEYLRLAYYGFCAKDKTFKATIQSDLDETIGSINIVSQDISRVLLNLYNNSFYAINEKKKMTGSNYEPTVLLSTKRKDGQIEIRVKDNGNGIPRQVLDKIFQPFFTTKPTGQGTGLGLSLSYDVIKAHGGEISVETGEGEFTVFLIRLNA